MSKLSKHTDQIEALKQLPDLTIKLTSARSKIFSIEIDLKVRTVKDLESQELVRLQLHGAIYCPDSFVLMLRYCANLKAIRYESLSLNRM